MNIFFDSSAFAKRYIAESGSEEIDVLCMQTTELAISSICIPEVISALARLKREKKLSLANYKQCKKALLNDIEDATICLLTPTTVNNSIQLIEASPLRAIVALHIASALEWQADLFVTSDRQQATAAEKAALNVRLI